MGVDDLEKAVLQDLTGAQVDDNGVIVSASEDGGEPVAIGFRAKKSNGRYRYFWLYRVKFAIPSTNLQTKGDSITFSTPSIEGTVQRRNKPDGTGVHPWKAEVTECDTGVPSSVISDWYDAVYEPSYTGPTLASLALGNLVLAPEFSPGTYAYTAATTNATNTLTATPASGCTVALTANGTAVQSGDSITWETGENTVQAIVTKGTATKTYTVTVTKS